MNVTKRLETLEAVAQARAMEDEPRFMFIRLISPDTKGDPMSFARYEGQLFERSSEESEDIFCERIRRDIVARHGRERWHRVILSVHRRDCS